MDAKKRLFRLFDDNENEIGHGVYYPEGESVQVYFDGTVHRGVGIGQVLCLEMVKSFMWCCEDGWDWEGLLI